MAQQLQACDEEVRLLAMVDCAPRTLADRRQRWKPSSLRHFLKELPFWKDVLYSLSNAERVAAGRFAWSFLTWSLKTKLGQRWPSARSEEIAQALEERAANQLPEHHRRLRLILRQAAWEYTPKPYRGRITLLRSTRYLFVYSFDRRMGWEEVAIDGVDVAAIPGDHESILAEPQVEALAESLSAYLTRAQQGDRPPPS
jgi:thioesterase domain-containing protein